MDKSKKLGQESAFPSLEYNEAGYGDQITLYFGDQQQFIPFTKGMSKRFYTACTVKNDFDKLSLLLQEKIVGYKVPRSTTKFTSNIANIDVESLEYAKWVSIGRAKWNFMQADEFLKQENV